MPEGLGQFERACAFAVEIPPFSVFFLRAFSPPLDIPCFAVHAVYVK